MFDLYTMVKCLVGLLYCFLTTVCLAQKGEVVGRVIDEEGQPSKGDSIFLIGKKLVAATTTDEDGLYTISNIRSGIYQIRLVKKGYRDHIIDSISVKKNSIIDLDIKTDDKIGAETRPISYTYRPPILLCALKRYRDIPFSAEPDTNENAGLLPVKNEGQTALDSTICVPASRPEYRVPLVDCQGGWARDRRYTAEEIEKMPTRTQEPSPDVEKKRKRKNRRAKQP
jgi:hypothetical protein